MLILGIETSCDETAVAIIRAKLERQRVTLRVLSNLISSQVKLHARFGGVVPSLAAREHAENLDKVLRLALKQAKLEKKPDLIAVTRGPGLAPALLVGVNFAKALAYFLDRPLVGVNHLEGHLLSNWLKPIGQSSQFSVAVRHSRFFPAVVLLVSGGHTELILMTGFGQYQLLGQTLDDAAGECFDKVARLLGLGYPGGPAIDKLATAGNPKAFRFPSPLLFSKDYNFSFSGLKTAILYFLRENQLDFPQPKTKKLRLWQQDIAASFQEAVTKVLVEKTLRAAVEFKAKQVFVCGGVAANRYLQQSFLARAGKMPVKFPEKDYLTDNAAMIAAAGFFSWQPAASGLNLEVEANLNLV